MKYQTWPKTGAILWIGQILTTLEESEIYDFASEVLCEDSIKSGPLLKANSHPDFYLVRPEEEKHTIKIDQLRALIEWSQSKPQISKRKVVLIYPAEAMNLQAANALLKTLEEVSLDTLFILASLRPTTLPATIISRCHIIRSKIVNDVTMENEDPLQSQVAKDLQLLCTDQIEPVALAASWIKQDVNRLLHWVMVLLNRELCTKAKTGNITAEQQAIFYFLDAAYEARRSLHEHAQLNTQLIVESLLIQYWQIATNR
jgi:DNA polymerase III delta prime subunit